MRTITITKKMRVHKLSELQSTNKIYLDDSFQSNERWPIVQKQEYMSSVLQGRAVTSIILADINSIVASLKVRCGEDDEDYIFFKNLLDQGYEYITIDGNNRDRCIADFFGGGFPLREMEYEIDEDYGSYFKAKKENKYYDDLPVDVRTFLDNIHLNVLVVSQATRVGLAELFIAVNKGLTLNAQEKRNAIMCSFGACVRDLSQELGDGFKKIFSEKSLNRRFADEMIVTAAVYIANGIEGVTGAFRDAAYTDNSKEMQAFEGQVKPVMTTIVDKLVEPFGETIIKIGDYDSGNFIDLIMLLSYMHDRNVHIDDHKAFYDWFVVKQSERVDSGDILYEGSKGTNKRTYSGLLRGTGKNFLKIRRDMLIESLSSIDDGVITFRDEKRTFDYKLRYVFWKRQEGICPLTLQKIEPRYIWDTKITQMDHNMPWSKGGGTTPENGQLVFTQANQKKSDRTEYMLEEITEEI